jgi:hypothetical protein
LQKKIKKLTDKIPIKSVNFFIIGAVFVFFLIILIREKESLLNLEFNFSLNLVLEIIGIYLVIVFLSAIVWSNLVNQISKPQPFFFHFKIYCITALGKRIPGTIWYIPWRYKSYSNVGILKSEIISASGVEYFISFISGFIVSILFGFKFILINNLSILFLLIPLIILFFVTNKKIRKFLKTKLNIELRNISISILIVLIFIYMVIWLAVGALVFLIAKLIIILDISNLPLFIGAVSITGVLSRIIIFLPTNFGLSEISLSLLLSSIMPMQFSIITALMNRILTTILEIILAITLLMTGFIKHNPKELLYILINRGKLRKR